MSSGLSQKRDQIRSLAERLRLTAPRSQPVWETGIPALNLISEMRCASPGVLVEWLRGSPWAPAEQLALQGVKSRLARHQGVWVVVDAEGSFCPSSLQGQGISSQRLVVIHPRSESDLWWAVEQACHCQGVLETWCWIDRVSDITLRRWKRALETGGGTAVLFRPATVRRQPSWADARWLVTARPAQGNQGRRVRVELMSCRGQFRQGAIDLEINNGEGVVPVVSPVACAAALGG
jgi:hypothetical protein